MTNNNPLLVKFGKAVKKVRISKGYTQASFAKKTKIHRTYIGSIERGERNITFLSIIRLSNALEINVSELLGYLDGD